jgi:hypothetical protein
MNTIKSVLYSGCYGGEKTNIGDIIVTSVQCGENKPSMDNKQIIFVVDRSGSMENVFPVVKAGLYAMRNAILRNMDVDLEGKTEKDKDIIFSKTCVSSIISFNNKANLIWESQASKNEEIEEEETYSKAIEEMCPENCTNMGDALQLAFSNKKEGHVTWIVLLTDGLSNRGSCQTTEAFKELYKQLPPLTKIIPLGYTEDFDAEVLSIMGNMTFVENKEEIPEIFGSITGEIVTCYGFDAKIHLPVLEDKLLEDLSKNVIGNPSLGCLYNSKEYMYGFLPWGNTKKEKFNEYNDLEGKMSYFHITSKTYVEDVFICKMSLETTIPDEIFNNYFNSSKGRILMSIYYLKNKGRLNNKYVDLVKSKLEDWTHPSASVHKEQILRLLNKNFNKRESLSTLTSAISANTQTGYSLNSSSNYLTPAQIKTATLTTTDAEIYMMPTF